MRQSGFLWLLISFICLGGFLIVYSVMNPEREVLSYVSGSATVAIAVLTMVYVYVTSRQLEVMSRQLAEMEAERRFDSQPLPSVCGMEAWIEKPRLFTAPPDFDCCVQARYLVRIRVKNIGRHPAVCVDVLADMEVPGNDDRRRLQSTAMGIPALGEGETYPGDAGVLDEFIFAADTEGAVIKALLQGKLGRLPVVRCRVVFRNIMGGCFLLRCSYRLYPAEADYEAVLGGWLTEMESFPTKHKSDMERLKAVRHSDKERAQEEFDRLKGLVSQSVRGEDMELSPWLVPGSFAVEAIDWDEYEKHIADVGYGRLLSAVRRRTGNGTTDGPKRGEGSLSCGDAE